MAGQAKKPFVPVTIRILKPGHLTQTPSAGPFGVSNVFVIISNRFPFDYSSVSLSSAAMDVNITSAGWIWSTNAWPWSLIDLGDARM